MRTELADIPGREPDPRLTALTSFLDIDSEQTGDALRVGVGLVNRGDREIALLNPFVLLQFELRDGAGYPLDLPEKPSPLLVNAFGNEDWTFAGGPAVVVAARNGAALDPGALEGRILRFAPGDDLMAVFALDRVPRATPAVGAPAELTSPLPAGRYAIGCLLTLIDAEQLGVSRILRAGPLPVRFVRDGDLAHRS
jgi:hypothetical protein